MSTLRVMTVPPEFLPAQDRADGYAVILGDCILPGHYLGRYGTEEEADKACRYFAEHYGLTGFPLDGPWRRRAAFTVILGGLSSDQSSVAEDTDR